MGKAKRTNALGAQLLANAALALAHSRGVAVPVRVKVAIVLDGADDEPRADALTDEQRAAIADGAALGFFVRDAAGDVAPLPEERAAVLAVKLRAAIAPGTVAASA